MIFIQAIFFAIPCWITNISFNFINPLKKKWPAINRINFPLDGTIVLPDGERLLGGSQGFLSLFLVVLVPLTLFLCGVASYPILLLKSVCVFVGDALGSFIKRRLHVARGKFLPGIDHGDYMLISVAVFYLLGQVSLAVGCVALILTYVFHPMVCFIGYKLKIKDEPL